MFARLIARITILAFAFALLGLAVGLIGKYTLEWSYFANPFWAVAAGFVVGGVVGALVSIRLEARPAPRR